MSMTGNDRTTASAAQPAPHDGRVILSAVVGSTAYGLAHEGSDEDRLGVYVAGNDHVLGLDGHKVVSNSHVTTNPDRALHEVGKFVSLALKCNPTILELLWADHETRTPEGQLLVDTRQAFLAAPLVRAAYGGYAMQQAKRLLGRHADGKEGFNSDLRKRTEKHGRHCYRLLLMGQELLATGSLTLDVSASRDRIFEVGRLAAADPAAFEVVFDTEIAAMDTISSVLPDTNDRDAANRALLRIRKGDVL